MSAIFLLPVCLTYWPRKYTTRVDPHVNSLKPLRRSVLELWVITFLIGYHWKCVRGRLLSSVTNAKALDRVNFLRVTLWPWPLTFWHWIVVIHDPWVGGQKQLHIWNPRPRFAYSLYHFHWATTTIKGRLLSSVTNAKALDSVNFLCVTLWPWPLTFWPWTVVVHGESRDQPCHQVWRP